MKVEIDGFLKDLIPDYLEGRVKDIAKLEELLASSNIEEIEKIAHKMAGNLGSYGFHELGKIAAQIEENCIAKNTTPLNDLISKLKADLNSLDIVYK